MCACGWTCDCTWVHVCVRVGECDRARGGKRVVYVSSMDDASVWARIGQVCARGCMCAHGQHQYEEVSGMAQASVSALHNCVRVSKWELRADGVSGTPQAIVHTCTPTHIHTHTYIHTHIHAYLPTYIHNVRHTCINNMQT